METRDNSKQAAAESAPVRVEANRFGIAARIARDEDTLVETLVYEFGYSWDDAVDFIEEMME